ncbi:MAG TPA: type II secretion system protein GspJ [Polyangia bacterium]|nr:type II secretion system protein GspJ [Polyangia bacterium]
MPASRCRALAAGRGMTLIEVMVAMAVMSMVAVTIWTATSQTARTRDIVEASHDRLHQVRIAFDMLSRDLSSAFLSMHRATLEPVRDTVFIGTDHGTEDRLDFAAFAHQRRYLDVKESDQCEVGWFVAADGEVSGRYNLVRRSSPIIDLEPLEGGQNLVLVQDVVEFDLEYFDLQMNEWQDEWDTTEFTGEQLRLPHQVRIRLVVNDRNGRPVTYASQVGVPMRTPIWNKTFTNPGEPVVVTR